MTELPVPVPGTTSDTLMWADPTTVEPEALDQLRAISRLPWLAKLRVMPDVHLGKGATVGSVIAMRDAVSPAAVGVDIGCGMVAARTNLTVDDLPDSLHAIRSRLEELVPVGWKSHTGTAPVLSRDEQLKGRFTTLFDRFGQLRAPHIDDRETRALSQSGTLGGGNHFLELQADDTGTVWLMLHSGSRNIGKELADRHITEAKGLDHNLDLPDRDLAVFLAGTPEMDDYLHDLYWAQEYARLNRDIMMRTFKGVITEFFPHATFDHDVNCHHNYVSQECYDGVDLIVTRKGAIFAGSGTLGLIPGSMATGSYVVRGLGNATGLCSASHGAGRRMSRRAARRTFTVDDLAAQTAGVESRKDEGVLDEIPGAYKDIDAVIHDQTTGPSPLVEVVARLRTLLCVKG
ncbi:RtcB family protein [Propionibacterium freudenreichii]|uniref:RtcB family protein n=1 Tax=Propionibacterium freudenreichii TaxID=1744 RepID=UPI000541B9EB|nr:RtcB family protein [Propionibacterium freudenreichii]MDN5962565.1 RtcB family protein [Propionibacterium sp.]AJQ91961.1 Protein RtcB [Propionibacterium freudenreichii subsp. freudenreichii]MCT2972769.1 RtcB family protein [Propionibacterium freudenreichii]MCT2992273.1 RtcB family protein [Propionibacterium freudenreichii]MCT2994294.1 RtcB family protein [Propionibacterium freudenreichii]